jgi:CubicO group peptidase (beta-lactamase class C family)
LTAAAFAVLPVGKTYGTWRDNIQPVATLTCTVEPGSPLTVNLSAPAQVEVKQPFPVEVTVVNRGSVALRKGAAVVFAEEGMRVSPPSRKWELQYAGEEALKFNAQAQTTGTFLLWAYADAELDSGTRIDGWSDAVSVVVVVREKGAKAWGDAGEEERRGEYTPETPEEALRPGRPLPANPRLSAYNTAYPTDSQF